MRISSALTTLHKQYVKFEARNATFMEAVLSMPVIAARTLLRRDHVVIRRRGAKFDINLRDCVFSTKLLLGRYHEPLETRLLEHIVRAGDVVIDVGANIGWHTVFLAKKAAPNGRVFAFEPDPTNLRFLRENVRINSLSDVVTVVDAAVGAGRSEATLYRVPHGNLGDQRLYDVPVGAFDAQPRERVTVPVVSLDDVIHEDDRVRLIKMDTQGYEPFALDGMEQTLQRNPRAVIVTEFWPAGILAAGRDPAEMIERLRDRGYVICELSNSRPELTATDAPRLLRRLSVELAEFTDLVCGKREVMDSVFSSSPFAYAP